MSSLEQVQDAPPGVGGEGDAPLRVLFVGGAASDAEFLRALLSDARAARFVLQQAGTLPEALQRIEANETDVLLIDIGAGDPKAIAAVSQARVRAPLVPVVVLVDSDDDDIATRAQEAGARGYLLRQSLSTGLVVWSLQHAVRNQRVFLELNIARERARQLAAYDQLTGLANRSLFSDRLDQAVASARRSRQMLAVLFLDLDRFKLVNDSLGHVSGDALLRSVAQRLRSCLRKSDTGARLGGDEFAILLTNLASEDDAAAVAEKLLRLLRRPIRIKEEEHVVTSSIGIATFPKDAGNSNNLLRHADTAMYHAKSGGRDQFAFFTEGMNSDAIAHAALESKLRAALEGGELVLHYQPVVDVMRGKVIGAEALLRWMDPEQGLVLPAGFLRLAEDTRLIIPIGDWVLRSACEQAAAWQANGHEGFRIAVNVSSQQFQPDEFVTGVQQTLKDTGLRPESLELELTERSLLHNSRRTLTQFALLKQLGIRISIDDFGTGYSALAYLKQLPVDVLKIDRSFVRALTTDPADATITNTIIKMAHGLNLSTVGEGVETDEQMQLLASYGCNRMQGFLFGEPLDPRAFEELLTAPPFWWMRGSKA